MLGLLKAGLKLGVAAAAAGLVLGIVARCEDKKDEEKKAAQPETEKPEAAAAEEKTETKPVKEADKEAKDDEAA